MVAKAPGLLGEWLFEGNANDASGNAMNGVVSGAVLAAGRFGQCYDFDGADDNITVARDVLLEPANAITISAWILPDAGYGETLPKIVDKNTPGGAAHGYMFSIIAASGLLSFFIDLSVDGDLTVPVAAGNEISTTVWTHVAATYDGTTGVINIFQNGTLTKTQTATAAQTIAHATSKALVIGDNGLGTRAFAGLIDSVTLWSRALPIGETNQVRQGFLHGGL